MKKGYIAKNAIYPLKRVNLLAQWALVGSLRPADTGKDYCSNGSASIGCTWFCVCGKSVCFSMVSFNGLLAIIGAFTAGDDLAVILFSVFF